MRLGPHTLALAAILTAAPALAAAQAPIAYRLSFPAPEHRWMQVEMTLPDLPPGPLRLRMSRASPGRYSLHEFAKNVYDVRVTDASGHALAVTRPDLHGWDVASHADTVTVAYKVFGDRVDGTYLGIDSTHAHINMPAALMWARGLDLRPVTVRFEPPTGTAWRVATQLFPGSDAQTFTAPNLQYLMDSPSEFGAFALRTFTVQDGARSAMFRVAMHHEGTDAELQAYAGDAETIVREAQCVFGALPAFDGGTYTFIVDSLPWASGDGMEHRNSTVLTSSDTPGRWSRESRMGAVAHEFFHAWNVERIRPTSLEPFDFDAANVSGELWLAEGFTNYYGPLVLRRSGLTSLGDFAQTLGAAIDTVTRSPGRFLRTAEEMSQLAPFVDAATANDRTNVDNTFISYYTWGEALALALDLTLRDRSDGAITLDDFMRALWRQFGTSAERVPGHVERPYTAADVRSALASVSGDAAFAGDFFARYIQGHDIVDYRRLLARAGLALRREHPGAAFAGDLRLRAADGRTRIAAVVPAGSPAYDAGLEHDDIITAVAGTAVHQPADFDAALRRQRPGATISIGFLRRGVERSSTLRLIEDPRQEVVPVEAAGQRLTEAERRFRAQWLDSAQR